MDVSLDELIKSKRLSSLRGGGWQGGSKDSSGSSNARSNGATDGGDDGSGGPMRRRRYRARRSNGSTPYSKDDVNASWTRNVYEGPERQQLRGGLSAANIHKIVISNLDYGVTSTDIQEIFNEFGPLKTATVHYDRSGRSLGTADVVFKSKNAALKAVRKYNNVPLDGHLMKIELATDLSTVTNLANRLTRPAPLAEHGLIKIIICKGVRGNRGGRGKPRGTSKRRGARGRGGRNRGKKMKSL